MKNIKKKNFFTPEEQNREGQDTVYEPEENLYNNPDSNENFDFQQRNLSDFRNKTVSKKVKK